MATRDQWYKPNLLYNIHYRPPKKVESPKLIVETSLFNPSVCTCGEHGCEPKYRMERRVLWSEKERDAVKQEEKTCKVQNSVKGAGLEDEERKRSGQDIGDVECGGTYDEEEHREGMKYNIYRSLQSFVGVQEGGVRGDWKINTDDFGRRNSDIDSVRGNRRVSFSDGKIKTGDSERRSSDGVSVGGDSGVDFGNRKIKTDDVDIRDNYDDAFSNESEFGLRNEKLSIAGFTNQGKDDGSYSGDERNGVADKKIHGDDVGSSCKDVRIRSDDKGVSGNEKRNTDIVGMQCNDVRVRVYDEGVTGNGNISRVGVRSQSMDDGSVSGDGCVGGANEKHNTDSVESKCNDDDGTTRNAGVCQNADVDTEQPDEEISSAFGIMSVYCNSELHSWRLVKGEDNVE